ncbi:peptide methionine sulfoxide reductase MsrA [Lipomyces japonicus]|uniref:peptide methionine sulfoxide reductase MsrA n=1 Tax=Lipomyces japonicus TaxID=56871 RepID=UPI0034CE0E8A
MVSLLQSLLRPFSTGIVPSGNAGTIVLPTISPTLVVPEGAEVATLAAGCFWGVEHIYRKYFGNGKGLLDARVGYSGGSTVKPGYRDVCTDTTGHAEALQIVFDPTLVSFDTLVDFFFRIHDPTTLNRQGPDRGSQYRSAIFFHSPAQRQTAIDVRDRLQKSFYPDSNIVTKITPIENWWDAETYHQLYLVKNPDGYECPTHFVRTQKSS